MSKFLNVNPAYANKTGPMSKGEDDMFCWGRVVAVHKIGEHEIIEYLDRKRDGCTILETISEEHMFHVNGDRWSVSCPTLDQAIVTAIAIKYDGPNSQAAHFFCKAIGMYDKPVA